jgi:hypothetical protein
MAKKSTFMYICGMDGHSVLVERALELYRSLGHFVEQVVEIDELRTDLLIASSGGERWVARCDSNAQITPGGVKLFLTHLANYKAQKAALITTGMLTGQARQLIAGKPLEYIDSATLSNFEQLAGEKNQPEEQDFEDGTIDWEGTGRRGRTGWRRWVRPVLMGLSLLAILLIILLLAWYGLLPL